MYAAAYVWAKVISRLEQQLTEIAVSAWFDDAEVVEFTNNKLILYSPTDFRQEIIKTRYAQHIEEAVKELFDMEIRLEVWGETEMRAFREEKRDIVSVCFNPQFSFENFVEGETNRFAKKVTMTAAQNPGKELYNPLFLYGLPGVGKTHLLYAAANYIMQTRPELKVVCIKTEEFVNELVRAIQQGKTRAFRNKYRQADVLLLDDIQFIAGKEATQEEFFHTFNALFENDRQIILTADNRPSDMATLADRLKDRFGGGVMVEIRPPDLQTRLRIVAQKAEKYGLKLDVATMEYIAQTTLNTRQIDGALKKIRACRDLAGMPLTLENVSKTVGDLMTSLSTRQVTPAVILRHVCKYYGVDEQLLKGNQRSRNIVQPRQIAMYLMRQMTKLSQDEIAKCFSRDRATVIHGIKQVEKTLALKDNKLEPILQDIRSNIEACE